MCDKPCVFCDIISGKSPARVIMENELAMVILDIHPFSSGHCLAIPKRHVPWWHQMTEEENAALFTLAHRAANKLMKIFGSDFICMYARGKRIPHTHIFLIPSHEGDVLDRFYNAMEKFQEAPKELSRIASPESLDEAAEKLK
ncbi:MAG: HIT family protein [Spirochaetes bacterium]|nr:HIT family protein [Spirochaetota bacterium]